MNNEELKEAIENVKKNSPKRKFNQSYDLIINIKNLDLKKTENHVDLFVHLNHERGKKIKICGLVGPELKEASKEVLDKTIVVDEFEKYIKDKKLIKKLTEDYDFFVAQANIMPKVAAAFGKVLGTRGKMPNPKAGCIVPPNANLSAVSKKLQHTVRVSVKTGPLFQCRVGNEKSEEKK